MIYVEEYYYDNGETHANIVHESALSDVILNVLKTGVSYFEERGTCDYYVTVCKTISDAREYIKSIKNA